MTTTAYQWRGGWLIEADEPLEPAGGVSIARIYGLNGLEQPIELTYLVGGTYTNRQVIQQWESLGGQMLMPRADDELTLSNFCAAQGIPYPTVFGTLVPLPAIYSGAGSSDATSIQGRPVDAAAPALNEGLIWDGAQWTPGVISPTLLLGAWNGTDATQFPTSTNIGVPVNPTLAFVGGRLEMSLDELTPDNAGAVWWFDVPIPWGDLVITWGMIVSNAGDGLRFGVVFGGDIADETWVECVSEITALPTQGVYVVARNGATPEAVLQDMSSLPVYNLNRNRLEVSGSLGDVAGFPPNGVPTWFGQFTSATSTPDALVGAPTFATGATAYAGAEWGTKTNTRVGLVLRAAGGVPVPVGGINVIVSGLAFATNPFV